MALAAIAGGRNNNRHQQKISFSPGLTGSIGLFVVNSSSNYSSAAVAGLDEHEFQHSSKPWTLVAILPKHTILDRQNSKMKNLHILFITLSIFILTNCSNNKLEEKGFPVNNSQSTDKSEDEKIEGIIKDSLKFETRPSNVLLTGISNVRLTTIYKVNLIRKDGTTFIGSNNYLYNDTELGQGNNWNGNLIPGLEGVYGYNLVNISHYDLQSTKMKSLFDKPVLIKTLYYPTFSKDTLNNKVVKRNFILVSVYNDDTNKDGFINQKDLRRFYLFNSNGERQNQLVPENYSVFKSEYDSENDLMFVFARLDKNANGQIEDNEPINIFWVDLKDPTKTGQQY